MKNSGWQKLLEAEEQDIGRGALFRSPAQYPYEDWVDFMVVERQDSPTNLTIMVSSGYKGGLPLVHLPAEAASEARGVRLSWIKANWQKWIYESKPEDVYFMDCYYIDPNWLSK